MDRVGIVEGGSKRLLCDDGAGRQEWLMITLLVCERCMMDDDTSTIGPVVAACKVTARVAAACFRFPAV